MQLTSARTMLVALLATTSLLNPIRSAIAAPPATLQGLWQFIGVLLNFYDNGNFVIAGSVFTLDQPLDAGNYTYVGSTLTMASNADSIVCPGQTGVYQAEIIDATHVQLTAINDACEIRKGALAAPISRIPGKYLPGQATGPMDVWTDVTESTIGATGEWSNKVELADINGDSKVDILFANGGDYESPGQPESSRVFLNAGAGQPFIEATDAVFQGVKMLARVIKVQDVTSDGIADIVVGTTFQTQSRLFIGLGGGMFRDATTTHLPQVNASVGDIEIGDLDGDGDLDLALADWGPGSPLSNDGGRVRFWRNDGAGHFRDVTERRMPQTLVKFSWELDAVDVDNDYDLDLLISCKVCAGSYLYKNEGRGRFIDATAGNLPQFTNNYEFEAMDVNRDGFLDLTTINDGPDNSEHLLINNQTGGYIDATASLWPAEENPGFDDNMIAFLDYDSDGDSDFLIGSLSGPDRLQINDGTGRFVSAPGVMTGPPTPGTLGIAFADLNGDNKLDLVMAQGENPDASSDRVYFGSNLPADTAAPIISQVEELRKDKGRTENAVEDEGEDNDAARAKSDRSNKVARWIVRARVHDGKSPAEQHDFRSVVLRLIRKGAATDIPMTWYGEFLWRADIAQSVPAKAQYQICATDRAGNQACSELRTAKADD